MQAKRHPKENTLEAVLSLWTIPGLISETYHQKKIRMSKIRNNFWFMLKLISSQKVLACDWDPILELFGKDITFSKVYAFFVSFSEISFFYRPQPYFWRKKNLSTHLCESGPQKGLGNTHNFLVPCFSHIVPTHKILPFFGNFWRWRSHHKFCSQKFWLVLQRKIPPYSHCRCFKQNVSKRVFCCETFFIYKKLFFADTGSLWLGDFFLILKHIEIFRGTNVFLIAQKSSRFEFFSYFCCRLFASLNSKV